jgi:hypothetical protein
MYREEEWIKAFFLPAKPQQYFDFIAKSKTRHCESLAVSNILIREAPGPIATGLAFFRKELPGTPAYFEDEDRCLDSRALKSSHPIESEMWSWAAATRGRRPRADN